MRPARGRRRAISWCDACTRLWSAHNSPRLRPARCFRCGSRNCCDHMSTLTRAAQDRKPQQKTRGPKPAPAAEKPADLSSYTDSTTLPPTAAAAPPSHSPGPWLVAMSLTLVTAGTAVAVRHSIARHRRHTVDDRCKHAGASSTFERFGTAPDKAFRSGNRELVAGPELPSHAPAGQLHIGRAHHDDSDTVRRAILSPRPGKR